MLEKPTLKEVVKTIKNMVNLNDLFHDSIKHNRCECSFKYEYVAKEMEDYIWVLVEYFEIDP